MLINQYDLRDKAINTIFIICAVFVVLMVFGIVLRDFHHLGLFFFVHSIGTLGIVGVAVIRKKLSLQIKALVLAVILLAGMSIGMLNNGYLESLKVLVIFTPVALSFIFPYKRIILWTIVFLGVYSIFGFLYVNGYLPMEYSIVRELQNPYTWFIDGLTLSLCVLSLLSLGYNDRKEIRKSFTTIEQQNNNLIKSERRYKALFEESSIAIVLFKSDGGILDCNPKATKYFNYSHDELLRKTVEEISSDKQEDGTLSVDRAKVYLRKVLGGTPQQFEWMHKRKEGEIFHAIVSLCNVDLDGFVYVQAMIQDISKSKRDTKELKETKQLLETALKNTTAGVLMAKSPNVKVTFANNAALEMFGESNFEGVNYSSTDANTWTAYSRDNFPLDVKDLPLSRAVRLGERTEGEELIIKNSSGKRHWVLANASPIFNNQGEVCSGIVVFQDITGRKLMEVELEKHRNNLEEIVAQRTKDLAAATNKWKETSVKLQEKNNIINQQYQELKDTHQDLKITQTRLVETDKMASLGILTAGIAHEINNPLNYIMGGYAGLNNAINGENEYDERETSICLQGIKSGIDRVKTIVTGLNQFSRNNDDYNEECEIHDIINNCLVMTHNQLKHKVNVVKEYSKERICIKGNVGKLHQVFINLIVNACQSIEVKGEIKIQTRKTENGVVIRIVDNGVGISKEVLPKIFEPFFTTKDPGQGTGLGLFITYNILKTHKGDLKYDSQKGVGTIAYINLPI